MEKTALTEVWGWDGKNTKQFDVVAVLGCDDNRLKVRLVRPGPQARPLSLGQ